jgi:hypothetical protein
MSLLIERYQQDLTGFNCIQELAARPRPGHSLAEGGRKTIKE